MTDHKLKLIIPPLSFKRRIDKNIKSGEDDEYFGGKVIIKDGISQFYKFSKGMLGVASNDFYKQKDLDIKNYAKYVLKNDPMMEKCDVLGYFKSKLVMKDKKIILSK